MNRKIISFVGLLLFVGVVAFNMQMVNSTNESNELVMDNIEALASGGVECTSECTNYPNCTIKISCDAICVEHDNYFVCGTTTYECSKLCDL